MKTVETGEALWFYPHAVYVSCAVTGDVFGCLTADLLPFPMPDFIPIFFPSAMGLLWFAHLPVLSWMCHPSLSALASTRIHCCRVYQSCITPPSSVMASEKLFQCLQCEKSRLWAHLPHQIKENAFWKFSYAMLTTIGWTKSSILCPFFSPSPLYCSVSSYHCTSLGLGCPHWCVCFVVITCK